MEEQEKRKARGGPCDHYRCGGGPCKQWAEEEFTPEPADVELGRKLAQEGWVSISSKYRTLIRWKVPPPDISFLVNPELRDTYWGRLAQVMLERQLGPKLENELRNEYNRMHRPVNSGLVEVRTISLKEFFAFKKFRKELTEVRDKDYYERMLKPLS